MGHDYPLANNRILTQTGFEKKKKKNLLGKHGWV